MIVCYTLIRTIRQRGDDWVPVLLGRSKARWYMEDYYEHEEYLDNICNWWLVPGTFRLDDKDDISKVR
jgi:hypothetical protein